MNDQVVEPLLQSALERAKETVTKIIDETTQTEEPIKEIRHLVHELADIYQEADWMRVNNNLFNPSRYQYQLEELLEIQKAALEQLLYQNEHLIEQTTTNNQNFFAAKTDYSQPQKVMAKVINQSLDNYDQITTNFREQATIVVKMQAAYFDWCKKSLAELSKPA